MKFRLVAVVFASIASLSACNSSKTASKSNFEKVINARLAEQCTTLPLNPMVWMSTKHTNDWYPVAMELPGQASTSDSSINGMIDRDDKDRMAIFDVLEKAGVFTSKPTKDQFNVGKKITNGKEYFLTAAGNAARVAPGKWGLCVGTPKVTEVVRYTKPSVSSGQTVSEVDYTYTLVNVPAWARDKGLLDAIPELASTLEPNKEAHDYLILMNDGWHDSESER